MEGKFIVFEGGEGSGKSSVINSLRNKCPDFVFVKDPSDQINSTKAIRNLLLSKDYELIRESELLLYMVARSELVHKQIIPALREGKTVISDRYILSTFIYQGCLCQWDISMIRFLHKEFCGDLYPDFTILFDIKAETGLKRSLRRLNNNKIDETKIEEKGLNFHEKVNSLYLDYARNYLFPCKIIDSNELSINKMSDLAYNYIKEFCDGTTVL